MLRLLEHYASTQGEGPRVGIPTQFVRFAGCNLKCPGWPCDSPHAIDPALFRKEQEAITWADLRQRCVEMSLDTGTKNICLTGGEPMLQPYGDLEDLIWSLNDDGFNVEMFSNGTLPYREGILDGCQVVMDWKLPGSGEYGSTRVGARDANYALMRDRGSHAIKFTAANLEDLICAHDLWNSRRMASGQNEVFCGPVWGKLDPKVVVEYILAHQLPWRLNVQVHQYVWTPNERFR